MKSAAPTLLALLLFFSFLSLVHAQTPFRSPVPWQKTQILTPSLTEQAVSEPSVLYENGVWRMWYRVGWSNLQGIYYATSNDTIHWNKYGYVTNGYNAHVYRYNSTTLLMSAHGLIDQYSVDGIHWFKFEKPKGLFPHPSLNQTDTYPNEKGAIGNSIPLKLPNGTYLMYYDARNCNSRGYDTFGKPCQAPDLFWAVNGATSSDGIDEWTRMPANPILGGSINGYSAANPYVVYENGTFYAFVDTTYYLPAPYIVESLATSTNGINFTYAYLPTEPVLGIDAEKIQDPNCNQVGDAWAMPRPDGLYLFYDADANVAVAKTYASIWRAFLPNTTLAQLAARQLGQAVPEIPTTQGAAVLAFASVFMLTHGFRVRRKRAN